MRYIGNKTKLIPAIEALLRENGLTGGGSSGGGTGVFLDPFAGTAAVSRMAKRLGFRVIAGDVMAVSHTMQVARVVVDEPPRLEGVLALPEVREHIPVEERVALARGWADAFAPLRIALRHLELHAPPAEGTMFRCFAPGGPARRRYFRDENARRIDGAHAALVSWLSRGLVGEETFHLLLASLVDGADRVANISGTYGAFHKTWQTSAQRDIRLPVPEIVPSGFRHEAHRVDALDLVSRVACDVLYIDPPYNRRQYARNYHVLEALAGLHDVPPERLAAHETGFTGTTGLPEARANLSDFCRERGGACERAFRDLIARARARAIVVSYGEEGILSRETIGAILAEKMGVLFFDWERGFRAVRYKRFRSDADRTSRRTYAILPGKERDQVDELLFLARCDGLPARPERARRARAGAAGSPAAP